MSPVKNLTPIDCLLQEHRIIDGWDRVVEKQIKQIGEGERVSLYFIEVAVDFFRTYADGTHQGKEETILFMKLATKQLSSEHKKIMAELMNEHALLRQITANLDQANRKYVAGAIFSYKDIINYMRQLIEIDPLHRAKEENQFFYQSLEYLSKEEQRLMIKEFHNFDRKMIHEHYKAVLRFLEIQIA